MFRQLGEMDGIWALCITCGRAYKLDNRQKLISDEYASWTMKHAGHQVHMQFRAPRGDFYYENEGALR